MSQKILIIDDDLDTLRLVGLMLQRQGYQISAATNGHQGLEKAFEEDPDLILLDVMMPRMSGFQVCSRLKKDASTRDIPIVMVTALNEVADVERAVESGADDFLTKPVNRLELLTRTRSLLRVSILQRQLRATMADLKKLDPNAG